MKNSLMMLGLAGALTIMGCSHLEKQKQKEDAEFSVKSDNDSHYLLSTEEAPERTPR